MLKTVYLFSIVWNGGIGPNGVYSAIRTYNDMETCRSQIPIVQEMVSHQFPGLLHLEDCVEVVIPGLGV